jgi:pseudouridine synthase
MADPMRLHKYMAHCGVASRRSCEAIIAEGRVRVNGSVITEMGIAVTPGVDTVEVDGKTINPEAETVYIALNKPEGYITTVSDPYDRPSVMDLIKELDDVRLYPVGRLDGDSRGLLLMTNDGDFAHRLTHPRFHVEKEYRAHVRGIPNEIELDRLRNGGVELDGRPVSAAKIWVEKVTGGAALCRVVIREGRNRQVRRMFDAVGHPVLELTRLRVGPVWLTGIEPGHWRYLDENEVRTLMRGRSEE